MWLKNRCIEITPGRSPFKAAHIKISCSFALNTTFCKIFLLNCQLFLLFIILHFNQLYTRTAKLALLGLINPCGSLDCACPRYLWESRPPVRITCLVVLIFNVVCVSIRPTAIVYLRLLLLKSHTAESGVLCAGKSFYSYTEYVHCISSLELTWTVRVPNGAGSGFICCSFFMELKF